MAESYRIFATETFEKDFKKLAKDEKARIEKIKEQLKQNPFAGKPLGYKFFREKKINGNRLIA